MTHQATIKAIKQTIKFKKVTITLVFPCNLINSAFLAKIQLDNQTAQNQRDKSPSLQPFPAPS